MCVCVCVCVWLEGALAVREVSDSISCWSGHKTLFGRVGPSNYIRFRRAVKRQWVHTLKHTIQTQEKHNNIPYRPYLLLN